MLPRLDTLLILSDVLQVDAADLLKDLRCRSLCDDT